MDFDATILKILDKLEQLRQVDADLNVFGASEHRYRLAPQRTEAEVAAIEHRCGIRLPEDYRAFLLCVGDGINADTECGGAGPGYGLYSVDTLLDVQDRIQKPFPLNHSILQVVELSQSDDYWPIWKDGSNRSRHGSLPLVHYGSGIYARLVLTGDARATVWIVDGAVGDIAHFADHSQYHLVDGGTTIHGGHAVSPGPHSFLMWYEDWLDASLNPSEETVSHEPVYLPGAYIVPMKRWEPPPEVPCPQCGKALRTATAKQCFECGANWHDS